MAKTTNLCASFIFLKYAFSEEIGKPVLAQGCDAEKPVRATSLPHATSIYSTSLLL